MKEIQTWDFILIKRWMDAHIMSFKIAMFTLRLGLNRIIKHLLKTNNEDDIIKELKYYILIFENLFTNKTKLAAELVCYKMMWFTHLLLNTRQNRYQVKNGRSVFPQIRLLKHKSGIQIHLSSLINDEYKFGLEFSFPPNLEDKAIILQTALEKIEDQLDRDFDVIKWDDAFIDDPEDKQFTISFNIDYNELCDEMFNVDEFYHKAEIDGKEESVLTTRVSE